MYTDEELDQLEQEEHALTEEAIVLLLSQLNLTKKEIRRELLSFYQKYGKDGRITYHEARKWISSDDRRKRMTILILAIGGAFDELLPQLHATFESMLKDVIAKEREFFDVELDDEGLLNDSWGADEKPWSERLADDIALWTIYLANDIKRAIGRQLLIDEVLEQIDKRFLSMEQVLEKLALTEFTAMGSFARRKVFKELGVTKYRFYTRADERTCEVCGSMHGLIFPISAYEVGVTASPLHPRCRCWEVPIRE